MRQQKERKQQARLPQPAKRSHHFRDDSPEEIEPDCSDTDTEGEEVGKGYYLQLVWCRTYNAYKVLLMLVIQKVLQL